MPASLENSAVSTGLEKASFHSNAKLRQCQRMFKLPYDCTNPTCQQCNTQNSLSKVSTVHEARTSRCSNWIQKRQRNQKSNCQHPLHHRKHKRVPEKKKKKSTSALLTTPKPFVDHNKLWKILQEMGIPHHLTCLWENQYAGQEVTVRTGHGTTDWSQIGKGVHQGCKLSHCLLNLYAECIMQNARLDKAQSEKNAGRNINNLRYADDTTFTAESEEELKIFL